MDNRTTMHSFIKTDWELLPYERSQTDRQTDRREGFYHLSHVIHSVNAYSPEFCVFATYQILNFQKQFLEVVRIHTDVISEFCGVKLQQVGLLGYKAATCTTNLLQNYN